MPRWETLPLAMATAIVGATAIVVAMAIVIMMLNNFVQGVFDNSFRPDAFKAGD